MDSLLVLPRVTSFRVCILYRVASTITEVLEKYAENVDAITHLDILCRVLGMNILNEDLGNKKRRDL